MEEPPLHRREESRTAYPDVTHPLIVSLDDVPSTEQMAYWPGKSSRLDGRRRRWLRPATHARHDDVTGP
jgi:hypothetical protein